MSLSLQIDFMSVSQPSRCLYCGSSRLNRCYSGVRDRLGFVPGERAWLSCEDCGSAVLSPLPDPEELGAFYPPVYSFSLELGKTRRWAGWMANAEYRLFFRPQYRSCARQIARLTHAKAAGRRLLDLGCGRGLRMREFHSLGYAVHGLDLQEDTVRYIREDLGFPATCTDVREADRHFARESFDIITAFYLLEHINDVGEFLRSAFSLLCPGGYIALGVPLFDSLQSAILGDRWINITEAPRHLSLPTRNGAMAACAGAGFENIVIVPDSFLNCAGSVGSSVVPGGTLTHVYGGGRLRAFMKRGLGAAVTLASLPFCLWENHVAKRPSLGIVFAQKPMLNGKSG